MARKNQLTWLRNHGISNLDIDKALSIGVLPEDLRRQFLKMRDQGWLESLEKRTVNAGCVTQFAHKSRRMHYCTLTRIATISSDSLSCQITFTFSSNAKPVAVARAVHEFGFAILAAKSMNSKSVKAKFGNLNRLIMSFAMRNNSSTFESTSPTTHEKQT